MSVVTVRIAKGWGIETKRRLAEAMTAALVDTIDADRASVTVLIEEFEGANWAVGGELQSDRSGPAKAVAADIDAIFNTPLKAPARKPPAKSRPRR
jgi:4-oxalocrotonate tautomerase